MFQRRCRNIVHNGPELCQRLHSFVASIDVAMEVELSWSHWQTASLVTNLALNLPSHQPPHRACLLNTRKRQQSNHRLRGRTRISFTAAEVVKMRWLLQNRIRHPER